MISQHCFRGWHGAEQATSLYLIICGPGSTEPIGVTRPQWVYRITLLISKLSPKYSFRFFKLSCRDTLVRHYSDVIMDPMASQITSLTIVYSTVIQARSKKTSKLRVTGLCVGNSPVTGEFPVQMASNAENVSIWWHHHGRRTCMHVAACASATARRLV